jgi:hypothetical protein
MHAFETTFIEKFENKGGYFVGELIQSIERIHVLPLFSYEFKTHPALIGCISNKKIAEMDDHSLLLALYFKIDDYIRAKSIPKSGVFNPLYYINNYLQQRALAQVEKALQACLGYPQKKQSGTAMLPETLSNFTLMKNIFYWNEEALIDLFTRYLQVPASKDFSNQDIPLKIKKREHNSTQTVKHLLASNQDDLTSIETIAIKIQRNFRASKRQKEEKNRIFSRYNGYIGRSKETISEEECAALMKNANTPYSPKCSDALSQRIMD